MYDDGPPSDSLTLEASIHIRATKDLVWRAFIEPERLAQWWGHMELESRLGGRFVERWTDEAGRRVVTSGRIVALDPMKRIGLSWADDDWSEETHVSILLDRTMSGTRVKILHSGWDRLADGERMMNEHKTGWRMHLENLRIHCERTPIKG